MYKYTQIYMYLFMPQIFLYVHATIRAVLLGMPSDGSYGIEPGLMNSFPVIHVHMCIYTHIYV